MKKYAAFTAVCVPKVELISWHHAKGLAFLKRGGADLPGEGGNESTPFRSGHFCCCALLWASSLSAPIILALCRNREVLLESRGVSACMPSHTLNKLGILKIQQWTWQWVLGLQKIQNLSNSVRRETRSKADQRSIFAAEKSWKNFSYRTAIWQGSYTYYWSSPDKQLGVCEIMHAISGGQETKFLIPPLWLLANCNSNYNE